MRARILTIKSCLLVVLSLFSTFCFADIRFEFLPLSSKVDNKDYSIGAIRSTIKDHKGFIWFGGENGLGRFDSQQLLVYKYDHDDEQSISSNFIWSMAIDRNNVLWIATSNGLNRYNAELNAFQRFYADSPEEISLSDNNVNTLAVDKHNNLLIGTSNGLSVFNADRTKIQKYYLHPDGHTAQSSNFIESLYIDEKGIVWVGTRQNGIRTFDLERGEFSLVTGYPEYQKQLRHNHISAIAKDEQQNLWLGTYDRGIFLLSGDGKFTHYFHNADEPSSLGSNVVTDIFVDSDNRVWVATDHGGLNRYNRESDLFEHFSHNEYDKHSLGSNSPFNIFEDDQGNLWVGLFPYGVSFLNHSATLFSNYRHKPDDPNSLSNSSILCFFEDSDGTLWIGTENGLNSFDYETQTITRHSIKINGKDTRNFSAVLSLAEDITGELLVGTWSDGLYRYNKLTKETHRYYPNETDPHSINSPFIWEILRDKDDEIWIATETGGLNRYRREIDGFEHFVAKSSNSNAIISNQLWTIMEDKNGYLWIATQNGLDRFDKTTRTFKHYQHDPKKPGSISGEQIMSLFEDSSGKIWIGTRDAGLNIFDPKSETFSELTVKDGLPSQTIFSIIEDKQHNIWVTTFNGVARINQGDFSIKILDESVGLLTNMFNRDATHVDKNGRLYLGSIGGISVVQPRYIEFEMAAPPVVITDFRILNQSVPIGGEDNILTKSISETQSITLEYYHTMFSFDFAALSYRAAENNRYAYKLENFDAGWNDVGSQRTAIYTNIDPGHYVFRVKAANSSGVWNEQGASINITINPPLWRSWWAYLSYALGILMFIYFINKHKRLRQISETYRTLSTMDALTGVYNRSGIEQIAQKVFAQQQVEFQIGLMVIDLDHFKSINDTFGHDCGDRVLQEFTARVKSIIRSDDYFGRWGGEEFILVSSSKNIEGLFKLAEKIRAAVAEENFDCAHHDIHVTVSIGIAHANENESFDEVVKNADLALYDAKSSGRNVVKNSDTSVAVA